MCYKINEHHLTHDVRPTIAYAGLQTNLELVNPYSMPQPCCKQHNTIATWFVCPDGHGCCYFTSRTVKCTAAGTFEPNCGILTSYHTYEKRVPVVEDEVWVPLVSLDQHIGSSANCRETFLPHHQTVSEMDEEIEELTEYLEQLVSEFFDTKAAYSHLKTGWRCDAHHVCERVLEDHCREFAIREELEELKGRLADMESEILALEVKFAVRRLRFEATAFGFTGTCDINNFSLK